MNSYIIGRYPFSLTIITLIVINTAPLLIYQIHPTSRVAQWFSAVLLWIIFIPVYIIPLNYLSKIIRKPDKLTGWNIVWSFVDGLVAFSFIFAGIWLSMVILDTAPNKNTNIVSIPDPFQSYSTFYGTLWITVMFIMTSGTPWLRAETRSIIARLWELFINIHGWLVLGLLLSLIVGALQNVSNRAKQNQQQQQQRNNRRTTRSRITRPMDV